MTDDEENVLDQEHIQQLRRKWLARIKHFPCPNGDSQAILVVDAVNESEPLCDADGHYQYRCPMCNVLFSVDDRRQIV